MQTDRQRIDNLEADLAELRRALAVAGAFTINVVQAALDQMVDERLLPSKTRTEIFGRIRKEISDTRAVNEHIANGARAAMPHYRTEEERAAIKHRAVQLQRSDEALRREILRPRERKPDSDQ